MPGQVRSLSIKCSECGAQSEILADGVPRATMVGCSRCGFELGSWEDLEAARPSASPKPSAASKTVARGRPEPVIGGAGWPVPAVADVSGG